jgi:MFS family permease
VSALVVNANTSAVTILLPAISDDLGTPVDQLQWAVTGYLLVGAAVIVTAGALGDILGRRRVFLAGLALFVASCALIALSGSGVGLALLVARHRPPRPRAVDRAAAAAVTVHTIPTEPLADF